MTVNLVWITNSGHKKVFPLTSNLVVIGRRRNCDLQVPLASVSRRHCEVNIADGQVIVRDLGSKNGTFLNGKQIKEAPAKAGDQIQVGPLTFVLQVDGIPEQISPPKPTQGQAPQSPAEAQEGLEDQDAADSFSDLDLDLEDLEKL